ncbi:MAG: indolepyruvate oxidoreductase subunit beta [Symbiobacteriaceae bacterium]|nr:indolepyruvate oxidoreductase subunit beta [Symbiobacteriaceae bacterium]
MHDRKILLVGVGGQGTILASRILAWIALAQGKDVKMSEIHGMAQRGGTVTTQICVAEKVYSPVIEAGEADTLLSFELLEAKRALHFLQKDGLLVVNNQRINPMSVVTGAASYPDDVVATLERHTRNLRLVDAMHEALQLGNSRVANVVLLGALSTLWQEIPGEVWRSALEANVPPRFMEVNHLAFAAGQQLAL